MTITIPNLSLVVLIGISGSGKSTFARKHFRPTEVLSSDFCRALVSDDENNQAATNDAFALLHSIAAIRLKRGKLVVIDATNVQPEARKPLVALARQYHVVPIAIVLDLPEKICHQRNTQRPDRNFGSHVIRQQRSNLRRNVRQLDREGFRHVYHLTSVEEIENITIVQQPLWNNRSGEHGPFDIIGDLHGCCDELLTLLKKLDYCVVEQTTNPPATAGRWLVTHPEGRQIIFLGDLIDRGSRSIDTLMLVRDMVASGVALCVPGNHDIKLMRYLKGRNVQIQHGLETTVAEINALPESVRPQFIAETITFIDGLVSHYLLDDGKLVVAHAGMKEELQGRASGAVRSFALFGETTGETDSFGLPIRYNWAAEYRGAAMVVYGHTPVPKPEWLNNTINIDTGCVFGGALTALRYPERQLVAVPANQVYANPTRPIALPNNQTFTAQQVHDDVLDIDDVIGKRQISTTLAGLVTIREENAAAALEVISRFAINPKWLIYLPPTMSPSETTQRPELLEHPEEAFAYYRRNGQKRVICEEKHMGSRAVVVICRNSGVAKQRFGVIEDQSGAIYTRTGRPFFDAAEMEHALLQRVQDAVSNAGLWEELGTDWLCLDCELMPWSAKAQSLIQHQYASVGAAAGQAFGDATVAIQQAMQQTESSGNSSALLHELHEHYQQRSQLVYQYVQAYQRYIWEVRSIEDLLLAPFHLLATEGAVHHNKSHQWHMSMIARICQADQQNESRKQVLHATQYHIVDLEDEESVEQGVRWWEKLTDAGGEGMVVKPLDFVAFGEQRGRTETLQPAIKCRGREYLRIIYGPEYTLPQHLSRLRSRGVGLKRSLAMREFALGMEALDRFVAGDPLRRVHECVFGVLALESEPVDPRL